MTVDILKMFVCFLAGAATGSGVAYLVLRDKFADQAQADIDEMKAHYENRSYYNDVVDVVEEDDGEPSGAEELREMSEKLAYSSTSIDMVDLKKRLAKEPVAEEAVYDRKLPYVITDESYAEEFDHHEKVSWTWYEDDDTLADESDRIIDARLNFIPDGCLDDLNKISKIICVRNENISLDMEIVYSAGTYSAAVYGIDDEEEDRPKLRKMRPQDE